jgi:PAS domain S-box-containing protein
MKRTRPTSVSARNERERLLHELEVHKIELEMQNQALREDREQLEQSRARYAELYDFAPVGHVTLGRSGTIEELNLACASLLGKDRQSARGQPLRTLIAPQSRALLDRHVRACFASDQPSTVELMVPLVGGAFRAVELVSVPPHPMTGEAAMTVHSVMSDISARKRDDERRDQLLESEHQARVVAEGVSRAKEELLAVVSHELRTPLVPMMTWIKALRGGGMTPELRQRAVEAIDACLEIQVAMIDDLVDDNFIGNKVLAKKMLRSLAAWSDAHGHPFDFFTEASVNLADDEALIAGLVAAGFSAVFLGIETPSREALLETQKRQNTHLDLGRAVEKLVRAGLEVMAGFIVGFDADDETIFERQHEFISRSPITMAMIGILTALPGTQLWRRLAAEGRLLDGGEGDAAYRPNFVTRLPEATLVSGYGSLLARLYEPRAYFERALRQLRLQREAPAAKYRRPLGYALAAVARSLWKQGVRSGYRLDYWRFLAQAAREAPRRFHRAVALAIHAEHFIRYTREDILPRLEAPRRRLAPQRAASPADVPLFQITRPTQGGLRFR